MQSNPSATIIKTSYAVVFTAMAIALAPYTSFPVAIAKINPTQHMINILAAVILGPGWAVLVAAVIGVIRNLMGVGTLLAFPGGMIGAFLAGILYAKTKRLGWAACGEIVGTGLIAPVVSAFLVAPFFMHKAIPALALLPSFLGSTVCGTILGILVLRLLRTAEMLPGHVRLR